MGARQGRGDSSPVRRHGGRVKVRMGGEGMRVLLDFFTEALFFGVFFFCYYFIRDILLR